jgi:hypothetical protein
MVTDLVGVRVSWVRSGQTDRHFGFVRAVFVDVDHSWPQILVTPDGSGELLLVPSSSVRVEPGR